MNVESTIPNVDFSDLFVQALEAGGTCIIKAFGVLIGSRNAGKAAIVDEITVARLACGVPQDCLLVCTTGEDDKSE
jgi:hypothetical protein